MAHSLDPSTPAAAGRLPGWVPIRSLSERHRPRIVAHLLRLGERDRYLRFGYAATDGQISHYVDCIDFDSDEVFGIFNRRLELVGMAHLAAMGERQAEFGVTVDAGARGRGWGARLFEHAVLHARNRRVDVLHVHALSENSAMLHIARASGAQVEVDGPDAVAQLRLPPEDVASHMEAMLEHHVAEWDYSLKVHARRVDAWLAFLQAGAVSPRLRHPWPGGNGETAQICGPTPGLRSTGVIAGLGRGALVPARTFPGHAAALTSVDHRDGLAAGALGRHRVAAHPAPTPARQGTAQALGADRATGVQP